MVSINAHVNRIPKICCNKNLPNKFNRDVSDISQSEESYYQRSVI